jgi:hypothetical protein
MTPFDPSRYSPPLAALWAVPRLPELGPGEPNQSARLALQALTMESAFPVIRDHEAAQACLSGLWLYHDFLDESHTISQDLPGRMGSYWHGIMHRREPDPGNAKYWFRRIGSPAVLAQLASAANAMGFSYTNPFDFVDLCERVRGSGSAEEDMAKRVQLLEIQLLFDCCYRQAVGA